MRKNNNLWILIVLVIAIVFLSIGFSAFSSRLTISSGATLNPNNRDFKVVFSAKEGEQADGNIKGVASDESVVLSDIVISSSDNLKLNGLKVGFNSPGQSGLYTFYVHNVGKYSAYLNSINFNNYLDSTSNKLCVPLQGTSKDLVDEACQYIVTKLSIGDYLANTSVSNIDGLKLGIDEYKRIDLVVEYQTNSIVVDGDFLVQFGDIILNFESTD